MDVGYSLMDQIHLMGIEGIVWSQKVFKPFEWCLLRISQLADPSSAFLLIFPLAYCYHKRLGVQIIWATVLSEWVNVILKWSLHGERPYWWVQETSLYTLKRPKLLQTYLTCETCPGSPSGHAMVTVCVWYTLLLSPYFNPPRLQKVLCYVVVTLIMAASCLCRCYISAHFPHQVIAGSISGYLLAWAFLQIPTRKVQISHYMILSVFLLISGPIAYNMITTIGVEPSWTLKLAEKYCAKSEWVDLDTTLYHSIVRNAGAFFGLGLALYLSDMRPWQQHCSLTLRCACALIAVLIFHVFEYPTLPKDPHMLFYCIAAAKYALIPIITLCALPPLLGMNGGVMDEDEKGKME